MRYPSIVHHGAVTGVTGSCHQLQMDDEHALLIDCGLFQGAETSPEGRAGAGKLAIDFSLDGIKALVATHVHIDHVGRIPYLLAAGFKGPILCSEPSAKLLPIVLEDAFKLGSSRDRKRIGRDLRLTELRIVALTQAAQPAIVIAGKGTCSSRRIVNYLKAMLGDERHDVLFVGYRADGAPGRMIQRFGLRNDCVEFDGQRYDIRAQVHIMAGYSARADLKGLVSFVARMSHSELRIVHGELEAKQQFTAVLQQRYDAAIGL